MIAYLRPPRSKQRQVQVSLLQFIAKLKRLNFLLVCSKINKSINKQTKNRGYDIPRLHLIITQLYI